MYQSVNFGRLLRSDLRGVLNWQIGFSKAFVSLRGNQAAEITHRCYPSTFQDLIWDMMEKGRNKLIVRATSQREISCTKRNSC